MLPCYNYIEYPISLLRTKIDNEIFTFSYKAEILDVIIKCI